MSESLPEGSPLTEDQAVLRAKYLDYCSARVAELFLTLSPDEIFVLAERADAGAPPSVEGPYDRLVRGAAEMLARKLDLPPFEEWVEAYASDPTLFEPDLMGLWQHDRTAAEGAVSGGPTSGAGEAPGREATEGDDEGTSATRH